MKNYIIKKQSYGYVTIILRTQYESKPSRTLIFEGKIIVEEYGWGYYKKNGQEVDLSHFFKITRKL